MIDILEKWIRKDGTVFLLRSIQGAPFQLVNWWPEDKAPVVIFKPSVTPW